MPEPTDNRNFLRKMLDSVDFEKYWEKSYVESRLKADPALSEEQIHAIEEKARLTYDGIGVLCFALMGAVLFFYSRRD